MTTPYNSQATPYNGQATQGTMLKDVSLEGTSLKLFKGQEVELFPPTNLPPSQQHMWFALPHRDHMVNVILIDPSDVQVHEE